MNSKERLRLYDVHYARFLSLYEGMSLAQLKLRKNSAELMKEKAGSPVETLAQIDVLSRLIKAKDKSGRNPDYMALQKACDALDKLDKSIQKLHKEFVKHFRQVRRQRDSIETRMERI